MFRYSDWEWDTLGSHDEPGYDRERLDRAAHTEPPPRPVSARESIPNRRTLFRGEGSHVYTDEEWEGVQGGEHG